MIVVNFKTYRQGSGREAVELAKVCRSVSRQTGVDIIPAVQALDLSAVTEEVSGPVFLQHLDLFPQGAFSGAVSLKTALEHKAAGTILNHSERKLAPGTIRQTIRLCRQLDKNFKLIVCCRSLTQARKFLKFKPDFLAYEPVELIGGDISVSTAKKEVVKNFVDLIDKKTTPVIGAGIKHARDIKIGRQLGAKGFLVASGVVLADDPKKQLLALASGFKQ